MKIATCLGLVLLVVFQFANSGELEDGKAAASRGDFTRAVEIWTPLASRGDANAQNYLGLAYLKGFGVTQDDGEAQKWFHLAAEQGHSSAMYNLGQIYRQARSAKQDYQEAMRWYRRAAEVGNADAQTNLGLGYFFGHGVIKDYSRAYMWLSFGAASGNRNAPKHRDSVERKMTASQISEAQRMARECEKSNFKNCD